MGEGVSLEGIEVHGEAGDAAEDVGTVKCVLCYSLQFVQI